MELRQGTHGEAAATRLDDAAASVARAVPVEAAAEVAAPVVVAGAAAPVVAGAAAPVVLQAVVQAVVQAVAPACCTATWTGRHQTCRSRRCHRHRRPGGPLGTSTRRWPRSDRSPRRHTKQPARRTLHTWCTRSVATPSFAPRTLRVGAAVTVNQCSHAAGRRCADMRCTPWQEQIQSTARRQRVAKLHSPVLDKISSTRLGRHLLFGDPPTSARQGGGGGAAMSAGPVHSAQRRPRLTKAALGGGLGLSVSASALKPPIPMPSPVRIASASAYPDAGVR